jgi:hypothetical protein
MRTILIILLIFFNSSLLSQIKDTIYETKGFNEETAYNNGLSYHYSEKYKWLVKYFEKSDAIYLLFEKSENQLFYTSLFKKKIYSMIYIFEDDGLDWLSFYYLPYKDFDHPDEESGVEVKNLKKRFLKKNSDKIIDISFIKKHGFVETFFALYNCKKKLYIIDKREFNKNKIVAREVEMSPRYIEE